VRSSLLDMEDGDIVSGEGRGEGAAFSILHLCSDYEISPLTGYTEPFIRA